MVLAKTRERVENIHELFLIRIITVMISFKPGELLNFEKFSVKYRPGLKVIIDLVNLRFQSGIN